MTQTSRNPPPIKITTKMRQQFKRNAPAALARRTDAYLTGIAVNVGQWLLVGALGLLGIYHWQWTASEMLLVFLAGIVAAILADSLKWVVARGTLRSEFQKMLDDRLVWAVLNADSRKVDQIPAHQLQPKAPGPLLLIDILVGTFGIWLLWAQLPVFGGAAEGLTSGVHLALLFVLVAPVLSMLFATFAHKRAEGGYDDLEFRAGGRGIGLVMLAGALAFFGEGEEGARGVMLFINWATIVVGVMAIAGVAIMRHERNTLREYLAGDGEASTERRSNKGETRDS